MTTHTPRARLVRNSGALRRADEIIDAAARVFAERGYHGTTTQAIADVLGMRQASLYYYFPSKEAALEEVCARGTDGFVEGAERVMQMDVPPLEKLKLLIASHLAPIETMPDYVRVFINERRYLPDASRKRVGRKSRRIERCFEQVIQAGMDRRQHPPGHGRTACHAGRAWHVQCGHQLAPVGQVQGRSRHRRRLCRDCRQGSRCSGGCARALRRYACHEWHRRQAPIRT